MCSVAMNFSKLPTCFIVRVWVRCKTVSSEHATSGATTYSFASTSGGAHGRIEMGGAGAGGGTGFADALGETTSEFGEAADALAGDVEAATTAGDSAAFSSAARATFASFAAGSVG